MSRKILIGAALLFIISGSSMAPCGHATAPECDAITCATPPVKPAKRDTTKTKKAKKSQKKSTKTKKQTTKQK